MILMAAFLGLCYVIIRNLYLYDPKLKTLIQNPKWTEILEATDILFSLPFYVIIFALAAFSAYELCGKMSTRESGITKSSYLFLMLYVTRMSTHSITQWIVLADKPTLRLQMTAHHLLSTVCFLVVLNSTKRHFYASFAGCCEFSTIFLNIILALKWFTSPVQKRKASHIALTKATSVMLWMGFLCFRIILFPMWMYMYYIDIIQMWQDATYFEMYIYPSVGSLIFVLSCIWFVPISQGTFRSLRGISRAHKTSNPGWMN